MNTPTSTRTTAEAITEVVASRVRYLRESMGMSQEDVALALNKVGVPWKRATVVNLETRAPGSRGKGLGRDAVTLEEFLGLALVLGVPPVGLLYDLRSGDPTPITNQVSAPPMEAALWTIGRRVLPEGERDADNWHDTAGVLEDVTDIQSAVRTLEELINIRGRGIIRATLDDEDVYDQQAAERMDRRLLQRIQQGLKRLSNSEFPHPHLPDFVTARADELGVALTEPS